MRRPCYLPAVRVLTGVVLVLALNAWTNVVLACSGCGCCRVQSYGGEQVYEPYEIGQYRGETPAQSAGVVPIQPGSWTLAILPDTQHYAQSWPQHFDAQTQFLVDHAESLNIKYVLHEGDIVNNNNVTQWNNARASLGILDGKVPYALAPGNHDYGPNGNAFNRDTLFHEPQYFGPGTPYATQPSIGGFFEPGKTDNSYHTFSAGGKDWLVLALEFGPRNQVVEWANQVVEAHPNHLAMLVTHAYMYFDDTIYDWASKGTSQSWNPHTYGMANLPGGVNDGQELWDKLVKLHDNFRFAFNGHVLGDGTGRRATLGDNDNVVHQILANYQMNAQGGMGDMRLLEFLEDGETVIVRTYSPVLDRYNTASDQEFTINMNVLPPPPPIIPHAVVANLVADLPTNPSSNTYNAVTIPQMSAPGVSLGQVNRGDFQPKIDGKAVAFWEGIMLASITQHDRPDFVNRRATVEVGRNPFGDGYMSLSLMEAGTGGTHNEVNFNTSLAWFPFNAGWRGAHVNRTGVVPAGAANGVEQSMVTRTNTGRYEVRLGVDSRTDGMLFATGNNNENIVVQTGPFVDGSGWDVRVQHNGANFAATGMDREWSFLYLPYDTVGLVGGHYDAFTQSHIASVGDFTMARLGTGQYELTIPGHTPETGMLITTISYRATASGVTAPDDNILTYEAGPTGSFLINSYDLPALNFQDTMFVWAFISFESPIASPFLPGDYDRNGVVDEDDYLVWQAQFGMSEGFLSADGNGDGVVDAADYVLWRKNVGMAATGGATQVPEPSALGAALSGMLGWLLIASCRRYGSRCLRS